MDRELQPLQSLPAWRRRLAEQPPLRKVVGGLVLGGLTLWLLDFAGQVFIPRTPLTGLIALGLATTITVGGWALANPRITVGATGLFLVVIATFWVTALAVYFVAPREEVDAWHLSAEKKLQLAELLKPLPKTQLKIEHVSGDGQGQRFAHELKDVFESAGWEITSMGMFMDTRMFEGLFIEGAEFEDPVADAVVAAFRKAGITVSKKVLKGIDVFREPGGGVSIPGRRFIVGVRPLSD
jgi:hypothetical protein